VLVSNHIMSYPTCTHNLVWFYLHNMVVVSFILLPQGVHVEKHSAHLVVEDSTLWTLL
jgi:hypothetical protein